MEIHLIVALQQATKEESIDALGSVAKGGSRLVGLASMRKVSEKESL